MANTKISAMTAASTLDGAELYAGVQSGANVKVTGAQIKTLVVGAGSVSVASGKTLTASKTLTLDGTDGTTMTFPATSAAIARTDAANTFTGAQTFSTPIATASVATMSATVGGGVPTPPNNTTTFLRGDGAFAAPTVGFTTQQFAAVNDGDQSITSATPVDIDFTGADVLDPSASFASSTFTVPASGSYRTGFVLIVDQTTLTNMTVELRVNGVNIEQVFQSASFVAATRQMIQIAPRTFNFTLNDAVKLRMTAVGSGISIRGVATLNSTWWAERVY